MSHKLQIVLPDPVALQLNRLARAAGVPLATLASQLVSREVTAAIDRGSPPRPPRLLSLGAGADMAPWIEPYGGDKHWRAQTWGAIVALYGRYPEQLKPLKRGWWNSDFHTEILAALAYWRQEIDDDGVDVREEFNFHSQLQDYARVLAQEPGSVRQQWTPDAPPPEWA